MQNVVLFWYGGDTMEEIINFNLRISETINNEIAKIAKKEGRSKNKQIEKILEMFITSYNGEKKDKIKESSTQVGDIDQSNSHNAKINIGNKK